MEISDFIRIKRNVDQIIQIELSGHPQKQIMEYISILENELIKKDVEVEQTEIEFDVDGFIDQVEGTHEDESKYYIGSKYTRKDLEHECNEYFEKYNLSVDLETLDPEGYHEQMLKAYNRMSVRSHKRMKKLKNQNQLF
tara:strand:+ start:3631 stop:4047 length:417 start_codon:yes stop_codon:yes gene_type:complete